MSEVEAESETEIDRIIKDEQTALLERVFKRVFETSMHDVPICNKSLEVEAIAYGELDESSDSAGLWLGVLVTPWCMNLMLLPGPETEGWDEIRTGLKFSHIFPAGRFEFITGKDDELGSYRMCSLFSPMFEFGDHSSALETALISLETLMDAEEGETISEQEKEMNSIWRGEYPENIVKSTDFDDIEDEIDDAQEELETIAGEDVEIAISQNDSEIANSEIQLRDGAITAAAGKTTTAAPPISKVKAKLPDIHTEISRRSFLRGGRDNNSSTDGKIPTGNEE